MAAEPGRWALVAVLAGRKGARMDDSAGSDLRSLRLLQEFLEDPKGCALQAGCVTVAVPPAAITGEPDPRFVTAM